MEPSVCSPLSYNFTIDLNQNCETDTFIDNGNDGISDSASACQIQMLGFNEDVESDTLTAFDVQFLEIDKSGTLVIINQDVQGGKRMIL